MFEIKFMKTYFGLLHLRYPKATNISIWPKSSKLSLLFFSLLLHFLVNLLDIIAIMLFVEKQVKMNFLLVHRFWPVVRVAFVVQNGESICLGILTIIFFDNIFFDIFFLFRNIFDNNNQKHY